jgi:hypothetical protein
MGVITARESIEIRACPPDQMECRKVSNHSLACAVTAPIECSTSPKPSPMILLTQGWLEEFARACSRLM